jgi:hypothetical protein
MHGDNDRILAVADSAMPSSKLVKTHNLRFTKARRTAQCTKTRSTRTCLRSLEVDQTTASRDPNFLIELSETKEMKETQ